MKKVKGVILGLGILLCGCSSLKVEPLSYEAKASIKASPFVSQQIALANIAEIRTVTQGVTNNFSAQSLASLDLDNNNVLSDKEIDLVFSKITFVGIGKISKQFTIEYKNGDKFTCTINGDTFSSIDWMADTALKGMYSAGQLF